MSRNDKLKIWRIRQVETILADRAIANGAKEYLVKWKGYTSEENSWARRIFPGHRHHPQISFQEEEIFLEKLSS